MSVAFKDVAVLRQGDPEGNRMIVRLTTHSGLVIHTIAVPQDWPSGTGPTWAYLFENEGLTLIDAGAVGSYSMLAEGIQEAGFEPRDIERVIVTHGHQDHDGAAGDLAEDTGAELWAHSIYEHLLPHNPWDIQRAATTELQQEMQRVVKNDRETNFSDSSRWSSYSDRHKVYVDQRRQYDVEHGITDGETHGDLTFMQAPGHSPDEICIMMDGLVFTGDHVLPEITPHPTMKTHYGDDIKSSMPAHFHDEDKFYGLATYLTSLQKVVDLGEEVAVLPAHRLFNRNKFNFQNVSRASEVIDHHAGRLSRILQRIGSKPTSLESITRGVFSKRKLIGGNLYMALSEIVAHIEILEDVGDLEVAEGQDLNWTGKENYKEFIHGITGR